MKRFQRFMGIAVTFALASVQFACVNIDTQKSPSDKKSSDGDKAWHDKQAGQQIDVSDNSSPAGNVKGQPITGEADSPPANRPDTEQVANGTIYWSKSQIVADGIGKAPAKYTGGQAAAMAMRAARIDAARNALVILMNTKAGPAGIDPDTPVQGILKNFEEIDCTYDQKTRTATCTIRVKF